ncbi:hypothetical protein [Caulobacter sp. NIBR1757]|uniref:hypothetical protein n=1 Tax=Caulobacter sp. NIBR1757 TaxID=3016000 RepID=UPI0022F0CB0F|nr:hypothetical protein [Caulobacter sp. NIBR1757]WGM39152.1 hypothetical protein AMEJIAPC_02066 [Caulobacter sp. NIBR1757]
MTSRAMSPAVRRYMKRFIPSMLLYVAVLVGSLFAIKRLHPEGPLLWALAVAPALPILVVIWVMGRYLIEETDEFLQAMAVQAMLWGIGITLAVATVWGFLENADLVPHLSSFLMFPLFCGAMGLSQPFIWRRYR